MRHIVSRHPVRELQEDLGRAHLSSWDHEGGSIRLWGDGPVSKGQFMGRRTSREEWIQEGPTGGDDVEQRMVLLMDKVPKHSPRSLTELEQLAKKKKKFSLDCRARC